MSNPSHDAPTDQDGRTGQVAETGRLDPAEADTPISDDQSVAGSPSDESGKTDAGVAGANSQGGAEVNGGDTE